MSKRIHIWSSSDVGPRVVLKVVKPVARAAGEGALLLICDRLTVVMPSPWAAAVGS